MPRRLTSAATRVLDKCLDLKTEDTVLITSDSQSDKLVVEALSLAIKQIGSKVIEISHSEFVRPSDMRRIHSQSQLCNVFIACERTPLRSNPFNEALEIGARGLLMYRITADCLERNSKADIDELLSEMKGIGNILEQSKELEIWSGSECRISMQGAQRKCVMATAISRKPHEVSFFPPGVIAMAPKESTANGEVLVNGTILGIGNVREPILLNVKNGRVILSHREKAARQLFPLLNERNGSLLCEVGCGINKAAQFSGTGEDERVRGSVHFAVGDNKLFYGTVRSKVHVDFTLKSSSLVVDEQVLILNGRIVNEAN